VVHGCQSVITVSQSSIEAARKDKPYLLDTKIQHVQMWVNSGRFCELQQNVWSLLGDAVDYIYSFSL